MTLLSTLPCRHLLAQEIGDPLANRSWQKRLAPIEILAGGGLVYLRHGPPDPYRQDVVTWGYTFGIASRLAVSRRFQIEGMILYERKGGKQYDDEQTADTITHLPVIHKGAITTINNYECITLPILVRYDFGRKIKYHVMAGPYFSYLLKATNSWKSSVSQFQYTSDITANMNNDIGYSLVFGVEIPIPSRRHLSIQIVNSNGCVNISKSPNPSYPIEMRTNSLFLVVGTSIVKNR